MHLSHCYQASGMPCGPLTRASPLTCRPPAVRHSTRAPNHVANGNPCSSPPKSAALSLSRSRQLLINKQIACRDASFVGETAPNTALPHGILQDVMPADPVASASAGGCPVSLAGALQHRHQQQQYQQKQQQVNPATMPELTNQSLISPTVIMPATNSAAVTAPSTAAGPAVATPDRSMFAAAAAQNISTVVMPAASTPDAVTAPSTALGPAFTAVATASSGSITSCAVFDADAANPNYNKSGLNGLTVGNTSGLSTGSFTVASQMPVMYTVQEVRGIFNVNNKALLRGVVPGSFPLALGPEPEATKGLRRLVVIDDNVERLYGQQLRQYFEHHRVDYRLLALPTCEENKHFELVTAIAEAIEDFKINRRSEPIIAIGGGVCLDVAGLAANLYRRNTGIIKVPTTVMAVVDASIGIKTAVNFHEKKNKLGTYCPPLGVLYDTSFLSSLEPRHVSNGAAEILKMACIKDRELFELLEVHAEELIASKFQSPAGATAIRRSIQGMLEELEYNLWEAILVRLVDYGHTISPELEMAALRCPDGMLLHGEAVCIDMALSTELAAGRGLITASQHSRVLGLMRTLQLPLWHEACSAQLFMKGLEDMTRTRDGLQRVPLMHGIGAARFVNDIDEQEMAAAAGRLMDYAAAHGCAAAQQAMQNSTGGNFTLITGGCALHGATSSAGGVGGEIMCPAATGVPATAAAAANNVVPYPGGLGQGRLAGESAPAPAVAVQEHAR